MKMYTNGTENPSYHSDMAIHHDIKWNILPLQSSSYKEDIFMKSSQRHNEKGKENYDENKLF